jgi:hypothetical protein
MLIISLLSDHDHHHRIIIISLISLLLLLSSPSKTSFHGHHYISSNASRHDRLEGSEYHKKYSHLRRMEIYMVSHASLLPDHYYPSCVSNSNMDSTDDENKDD